MNYFDTCWVERHEVVALLMDNILPIMSALEQIMMDDKDNGIIGGSLLKKNM